jgi:hypothetical protein
VQPQLEKVLIPAQVSLRRVFRHYAAGDGVGCTMTVNEFTKFVQDAKLVGKTLKLSHVKRIFKLANEDGYEDDDFNESRAPAGEDEEEDDANENPDEEFIPSEFSEAIIRLACKKFSRPYSVADRTVLLMEVNMASAMLSNLSNLSISGQTYVLKNAMRSEKFREALSQPKVKEVFSRYKACLRRVFRYYAAGGQNPKKGEKRQKGDDTMDLGEFNLMVKV